MTLIWSVFCVFLFACNGAEGNISDKVIKQNEAVSIKADLEFSATTVFWIRLRENGQDGFEQIGTYSKRAKVGKVEDTERFEVTEKTLKLKNFDRLKDSGTYSCVSINNNMLQFDCVTKLHGEPVPTTRKPKVETPRFQTEAMTKATVTCGQSGKAKAKIDVLVGCELHIFIPLAAGCGLLLLILIFTIFYCNSIRTKRCPHHYKRQPRSRPAGHKTLPNPPDY